MSDPKIKYDIEAAVSGSEKIVSLAGDLEALGRSVDTTAAGASHMAALRKEIETLGQQQAAIEKFRALKLAVDDADTTFKAAQTIAQGLGHELANTADASALQRGMFARARDEVVATKQAWLDNVAALQAARNALAESGINTQKLATEQLKLSGNVNSTVEHLNQLKSTLASAGNAMGVAKTSADQTGVALEQAFKVLGVRSVQAVEAEIKQLHAAMQVVRQSGSFMSPDSERAAGNLKTKLAELEAELKGLPVSGTHAATGINSVGSAAGNAQVSIASATGKVAAMVTAFAGINGLGDLAGKVISTGASFETLRTRLDQLLGSQQKSAEAFGMIKQLATTTPFEVTALTESFAKLTSFGIQPTEKQMRALADTAAAAGGGTQNLERVSLALGQAWAKQKLQGDEILQLVEAGVPAWDLLSTATGKNVVELQKMAEAGALGRDVITKLWEAMGDKSAGASERLMHTFAGTVSNAKDAMAEFFDLISRSGVLEYLAREIQNVLTEFEKLKNNGELERKAQAISTAVTGIADVLKNTIGIVSQFSGVIGHLLEAMVVRNIIAFGVSLTGLGVAGGGAAAGVAAAGAAAATAGTSAAGAALGVRALGAAIQFLKAALPMGILLVALDFLVAKFFAAKKAADDGDAAVTAMLNEKGTGGAAKAVEQVGTASEKAARGIAKLTNDIAALSGAGLADAGREFARTMTLAGTSTAEISKGLAEVGVRAAQALGVDTTLATNKVSEGFKDANVNLGTLISTIPNLKEQGVDTAVLVGTAMGRMIESAKSAAEIEIINKRLQELGQRGILTGADVTAALKQSADKATTLKEAIEAGVPGVRSLGEAAKKAGVDVGELTTGVSKSFKDSLGDFDTLATNIKTAGVNAQTAAPQLAKALDQRLSAAQTKEEIVAVIERFKTLGAQGQLTGDQLRDGLQKANAKLAEMTPGINSLAEAYKQLGLKAPEELNKIAAANKAAWDKISLDSNASLETTKAAFTTYANSAVAANGNVSQEVRLVREDLLKTEAAAKGLALTFDATGKLVVQTQAEAKAAIDKTTGALGGQKNAVDDVTSALERQNAAQERLNAATEKALELENKRLNRDKEGFSTDKNGGRINAGGDLNTLTGIASFLKSAGVADDNVARKIAREFADEKGNVIYANNPGQKTYGGDTISMALNKAAESYTFGIGGNSGNAKQTGVGEQPSTIPQQSNSYTVNIPAFNTAINVASAKDAGNLTDFIKQLSAAKLSAGG